MRTFDAQEMMDVLRDEFEDDLEEFFMDSVQPGVCVHCKAIHDSCEPDMEGGDMGCCSDSWVIALEQLLFHGGCP